MCFMLGKAAVLSGTIAEMLKHTVEAGAAEVNDLVEAITCKGHNRELYCQHVQEQ